MSTTQHTILIIISIIAGVILLIIGVIKLRGYSVKKYRYNFLSKKIIKLIIIIIACLIAGVLILEIKKVPEKSYIKLLLLLVSLLVFIQIIYNIKKTNIIIALPITIIQLSFSLIVTILIPFYFMQLIGQHVELGPGPLDPFMWVRKLTGMFIKLTADIDVEKAAAHAKLLPFDERIKMKYVEEYKGVKVIGGLLPQTKVVYSDVEFYYDGKQPERKVEKETIIWETDYNLQVFYKNDKDIEKTEFRSKYGKIYLYKIRRE